MKKMFNWSELHLIEVTSYKIHTLIRNSFLMRNLKLRKINQPNIYIALALPDLQFYDLPIANVSNWAKWYAQWVEIISD